jgi:hypothetical protein
MFNLQEDMYEQLKEKKGEVTFTGIAVITL